VKAHLAVVSAIVVSASTVGVVDASVRGGCAGTIETGRSDAVGWIDTNVMLQLGEPEAPHRFLVEAPDGSEVAYSDGAGLTPPSEAMPVWLAPASKFGTYRLDVDGYECTVEVTSAGEPDTDAHDHRTTRENSGSARPITDLDRAWEIRSAPLRD
jgi:hypothetical protein